MKVHIIFIFIALVFCINFYNCLGDIDISNMESPKEARSESKPKPPPEEPSKAVKDTSCWKSPFLYGYVLDDCTKKPLDPFPLFFGGAAMSLHFGEEGYYFLAGDDSNGFFYFC